MNKSQIGLEGHGGLFMKNCIFGWTIPLSFPVLKSGQYTCIAFVYIRPARVATVSLSLFNTVWTNITVTWQFLFGEWVKFVFKYWTESIHFVSSFLICFATLFSLHNLFSIGWALMHNFLSIKPFLLWTRLRKDWLNLSYRYVLWLDYKKKKNITMKKIINIHKLHWFKGTIKQSMQVKTRSKNNKQKNFVFWKF